MHIGIDCRLYGLQHAGIGRYIQNLVLNLSRLDTANHYTLFVADPNTHPGLPSNFNLIPAPIRHYSLSEQTRFLGLINSVPLDLMHFPHFNLPLFYHRPFVVTIHDLLWHKKIGLSATTLNPAAYLFKYIGYRIIIKNAINRSQSILTPSTTIKHSIIKTFSTPASKIYVTPEAPDAVFSQTPQAFKLPPTLTKPFIIYTGSLYPHKNVNTLIDSLHHLSGITLAISSARNIFEQQTRDHVYQSNLKNRVKFLGRVPDEKLVGIYHQALALIQPSLSEGFGLTGLEAMASGLPVICSDHPVLREIYGPAALYVDTASASSLAQTITQLQNNPKLRSKLVKLGKIQAGQYSWAKMAQQTLSVYTQNHQTAQTGLSVS